MQSFRAVPWSSALVTGASAGIGEEIARNLASRGVGRLVLVARRADRLEALAAELRSRHGSDVEILAADLAQPASRAIVEARLAEDGDRAIDLLVNNAGFGTAGDLVGLPIDEEERQIDVNVTALVRLTRAALPGMVGRGVGAVMNISSMATYQPSPGMATYGGTKAFVTMFSESLYEELRGTGVTVTAVLPGFTRTEFQSHIPSTAYDQAPSFAWTKAADVARLAVTATAKGRALCVPGLLYQAAAVAITPLPRTARRLLIAKLQGLPAKLAERERPAEPAGLEAAESGLPMDPSALAPIDDLQPTAVASPAPVAPVTPAPVAPTPVPPASASRARRTRSLPRR